MVYPPFLPEAAREQLLPRSTWPTRLSGAEAGGLDKAPGQRRNPSLCTLQVTEVRRVGCAVPTFRVGVVEGQPDPEGFENPNHHAAT